MRRLGISIYPDKFIYKKAGEFLFFNDIKCRRGKLI